MLRQLHTGEWHVTCKTQWGEASGTGGTIAWAFRALRMDIERRRRG